MAYTGALLLNKPSGITSFAALGPIKHQLKATKVGHTGTLDRFAEGLLVVLTGHLTKLNPLMVKMDKRYLARVRFGVETATLDPEGEIVRQAPVPNEAEIRRAIPQFVGSIWQRPPRYSALHVDGERAWRRVLRGEQGIDLPERRIDVHSIDIQGWDPPDLEVDIRCSKGTYVRSIARDLAERCGSAGHLQWLRRIEIGPFSVDQAVAPKDFDVRRDCVAAYRLLSTLPEIECIDLPNSEAIRRIRNGEPLQNLPLPPLPTNDGYFALFGIHRELIAVCHRSEGICGYLFVTPS